MAVEILKYDVCREMKPTLAILKGKIKPCVVKLTLNDEILDALEQSKDRDLVGDMIQAKGLKLCKATAGTLQKLLKQLEDIISNQPLDYDDRYNKVLAGFDYKVKQEVEKLEEHLERLPKEHWAKFLKKYGEAKKEYKKYKLNAGVDMGVGTVGLLGSLATLGAAVHTGGASLAFGLVGMGRSIAKIADTNHRISTDVDTLVRNLDKDITKLLADFRDAKKKSTAKDLGQATLSAILGGEVFNTVARAEKTAHMLPGKLDGLWAGGVKLAREVTESLNKIKKLQTELGTANGKGEQKIKDKIKKLQDHLPRLFQLASLKQQDAKSMKVTLKKILSTLDDLKNKTGKLATVEKGIEIGVTLLITGASAGAEFSQAATKTAELSVKGVEMALTSETLTKEIVETGKQLLDWK